MSSSSSHAAPDTWRFFAKRSTRSLVDPRRRQPERDEVARRDALRRRPSEPARAHDAPAGEREERGERGERSSMTHAPSSRGASKRLPRAIQGASAWRSGTSMWADLSFSTGYPPIRYGNRGKSRWPSGENRPFVGGNGLCARVRRQRQRPLIWHCCCNLLLVQEQGEKQNDAFVILADSVGSHRARGRRGLVRRGPRVASGGCSRRARRSERDEVSVGCAVPARAVRV